MSQFQSQNQANVAVGTDVGSALADDGNRVTIMPVATINHEIIRSINISHKRTRDLIIATKPAAINNDSSVPVQESAHHHEQMSPCPDNRTNHR
jgi:hypothetical protein